MFSSDEEKETPEGDSSCAATVGTNPTPGTEKDFDFNGLTTDEDGHKVKTKYLFAIFMRVMCVFVCGLRYKFQVYFLLFLFLYSFVIFCCQNFKVFYFVIFGVSVEQHFQHKYFIKMFGFFGGVMYRCNFFLAPFPSCVCVCVSISICTSYSSKFIIHNLVYCLSLSFTSSSFLCLYSLHYFVRNVCHHIIHIYTSVCVFRTDIMM